MSIKQYCLACTLDDETSIHVFIGEEGSKFYEVSKQHTLADAEKIIALTKEKLYLGCTEEYLKGYGAIEMPFLVVSPTKIQA